MKQNKVQQFYIGDFESTLYPLNVNRILIENAYDQLTNHIKAIFNNSATGQPITFLPQEKVTAPKRNFHLRRTIKLDPVAEFFIYRLVLENGMSLGKAGSANRTVFGFYMEKWKPAKIESHYAAFKKELQEICSKAKFKYCLRFDIAAYFNSIYHHDITGWFAEICENLEHSSQFGTFLRQINSGKSNDCFPQGIMPAKILGSQFLSFVDSSVSLKSEKINRFMDDFVIFSDQKETLLNDFYEIQRLLGQKGLNLNSSKTKIVDLTKGEGFESDFSLGDFENSDDPGENIRRAKIIDFNAFESENLNEREVDRQLKASAKDANRVIQVLKPILANYPALVKRLYYLAKDIGDKDLLSSRIYDCVVDLTHLSEYQLFWLAKLAEEFLGDTENYGALLREFFKHPNASNISKAKILEIPENRFGLPEWRREQLQNGHSGWLSWAAAAGCRDENKASRNYVLKYFSKCSPMNNLIAGCVTRV